MPLMTGNSGKQPDASLHIQLLSNQVALKQNLSCIILLSHPRQELATIPTQNVRFVKGKQRLKLIAENATLSFKMRFRYYRV